MYEFRIKSLWVSPKLIKKQFQKLIMTNFINIKTRSEHAEEFKPCSNIWEHIKSKKKIFLSNSRREKDMKIKIKSLCNKKRPELET